MMGGDTAFTGSIPDRYHTLLGPNLFAPYAAELARRARALNPRRILETASGTGIVTAELLAACRGAHIVATDLNQAMLDRSAQWLKDPRIDYHAVDAQDLPFPDETFDLVVCQFGMMFLPDRVKGYAEAARVLKNGGRLLVAIWDAIERNDLARVTQDAVAGILPDPKPSFLPRTPYGHGQVATIERECRAAGFSHVLVETVEYAVPVFGGGAAADGFTLGSPMAVEIDEHDPALAERAREAARRAVDSFAGPARLSALVATATKGLRLVFGVSD